MKTFFLKILSVRFDLVNFWDVTLDVQIQEVHTVC